MLTEKNFTTLMSNFETTRFKEENYLWEELFLETMSLHFPNPQEFLNKADELLTKGSVLCAKMDFAGNTIMTCEKIETWKDLYNYLINKKD